MKTLYLDLASNHGSIACVSESAVTVLRQVDHRISDSELAPMIQEIVQKAGWSMGDLTNLACVLGPGGFTSLRVAVATVNALSYALGIPSVGIHLSDLYLARTPPPTRRGPSPEGRGDVFWFHSTKKTHLFVRGFGEAAEIVPDPVLMTVEEADAALPKTGEWMGELIPEHRTLLEKRTLSEVQLQPLDQILPAFLVNQSYTEQTLEPWYGRGW